jgi:glucose-6-phosphate 1-epimerase
MATGKGSNWDDKFGVSGRVGFTKGNGGLPKVSVTTEWSSAEIYLHGAHLTHFQRKNEEPILFLSKESRFEAGQAIRGGIPVIFPWFGPKEGHAAHGFARVKEWELKEIVNISNGGIELVLSLSEGANTEIVPFSLEYTVGVGETLALKLIVKNESSDKELTCEDCLHTYFNVGGIDAVSISGLKGANYRDKVEDFAEKTETASTIKIASEVDRVYMDTTSAVEIHDASFHRKIRIEKENSASTVVWNPWIVKAKAMPDFGDEEYQKMVCVESGNVGKNKMVLAPGKSAALKVDISSGRL